MTTPTPSTVREQIENNAAVHADNVFLIAPDDQQQLTFAELKQSSDELGERLDCIGVAANAKVAFLLDNGASVVRLFLGIMANNRVAVPLNAVAGPNQLRHVLNHSDSELIFVAPHYRDKLNELLAHIKRRVTVVTTSQHGPEWREVNPSQAIKNTAPPSADDAALLLYTSGSTGTPKGALLSHRAILRGGQNVVAGHHLTAHDRALCVLPVYHINGAMVTVCAPLVSGGGVVMPTRFSARAFWNLAAQHQCTWASVVPTMINYLLDRADKETFSFGDDARLKNFSFARSASAPLPAVVLRHWQKTFCVPMIETLGLTETAGTVASNPMPPAVCKPGSVGRACGNDIKIINGDGGDCEVGVAGEIVVRGDNLLDGYYKDDATTRDAFAGDWFRTGDIGLLDDDGFLFITGRLKELILRGGENIAPREIDDVLYQHEAILEAAAVGVDDTNYGQEVVACVALRDGFSCDETTLKQFCEDSVGAVKTPKTIYFLKELPKGPSGKILRLELPKIIAELGRK